jgi:hypothetical protein
MKSCKNGKKLWIFPDADLPPAGDSALKGHESIIVLNMNDKRAVIQLILYFTDKEPKQLKPLEVEARRVRCIRLDNEEEIGYSVPLETQYAVRLESDVPVVVQYGRLDARQNNLAFYTTMGYCPG